MRCATATVSIDRSGCGTARCSTSSLLIEVYGELTGGRQRSLIFAAGEVAKADGPVMAIRRSRPSPLPQRTSQIELDAHAGLIKKLGDGAVWRRYLEAKDAG